MEEELKEGPLEPGDFKKVFGITSLPKMDKRPLVLFTGSGIGNILKNSRTVTVGTAHGKVKLLVGEIEGTPGLPVVVVPRHSNPEYERIGHHLLPHQLNEPAYSVVVAALNPIAVVTMHTVGVAKVHKSFKPGRLAIIANFKLSQPTKTIYSREVVHNIVQSNYNLPSIAHTPLPESKLKDSDLANIIKIAAENAKIPLAEDLIAHTIPGPHYETTPQVKSLVAEGINAFSMTHQNDAITLQEALQAVGSDAKVVSIATISNFAQGFGKPPSHAEVDKEVKRTAPKRTAFLKHLAKLVKNSEW